MSGWNIDFNSVRYTQEYFYPYFSKAEISVSETYIALANGFLDPASLAPITIFEYEKYLYCIDTRRLTIAKELQRRGKLDVLKKFPIQLAKKCDAEFKSQYSNFENERLRAMKRDGLDGSTIKLYRDPKYMCCFDKISGNFRDDLEEHIARDHVNMELLEFKNLNICRCNRCTEKFVITALKPSNKSGYKFIRNCACRNAEQVLHKMDKPWIKVTFRELCNTFRDLKRDPLGSNISKLCIASSSFTSTKSRNELQHGQSNTDEVENITSTKQFCVQLLFFIIISYLFYVFFNMYVLFPIK